jgi:4-diphosphocytidyl-2-C-methyl-D-erythritol kinase
VIAEFAPAKINLSLRVVGKRADGYHLLDSIVAFADVGDRLTFEEAGGFSLAISGPFAGGLAADESNLVLRAARALAAAHPGRINPARITLEKNLPLASGIGGGSADAAAALRGLSRLSGISAPLEAIALALGADVPVCLDGKPCRMRGIGEDIESLPDFEPRHALLVNPGVSVATKDVFARLRIDPGSQRGLDVNDLEAPALSIAPVIGEALAQLRSLPGCHAARMSGSGATCFGLFASSAMAAAAAATMAQRHSAWWCRAATIGAPLPARR